MKKFFVAVILLGLLSIPSQSFAYTVKKGDTMTEIARQHGFKLAALAEANPAIQDLDVIFVGQTVHIPESDNEIEMLVSAVEKNEDEFQFEKSSVKAELQVSEQEMDLLARIVRAEAQTEPFDGKVGVANVVLNRVESSQFPDTIEEVIYEPGQFQPVSNGEISRPADEDSIKAVHAALADGLDVVQDSLFFYNPDIATNRWLDTRETTVKIGDHVFKK